MVNLNEPPPPISTLQGTFTKDPQRKHTGKLEITIGLVNGRPAKIEVLAKDHKPTSLTSRFQNWVEVKIEGEEGTKSGYYWVNVTNLADKLGCTERSILKAAEVGKSLTRRHGELETWIAMAPSYAAAKAHFKETMSKEQIRKVCRQAVKIGQDNKEFVRALSQAEGKAKGGEIVQAAEKVELQSKSNISKLIHFQEIHEHHFKHLPFTLLEEKSLLLEPFGAGSYKAVYKLIKTGDTIKAFALASPSEKKKKEKGETVATADAQQFAESEAYILTLLKGKAGIIQIDHVFYYLDVNNNVKVGFQLHFVKGGDLNSFIGSDKLDKAKDAEYDAIEKEILDKAEGGLKDPEKLSQKLDILTDVAEGLINCHKEGIINADVKPANILLDKVKDENGKERLKAYVADFGLAFSPNSNNKLLPNKHQGGTQSWHAPEVWEYRMKHETNPGPEIDAFAFGLTMCELLFGKLPLWCENLKKADATNWETEKKNALVELEKIRKELQAAPPFGPIIAKLLDPDPKKRNLEEAVKEINLIKKTLRKEEPAKKSVTSI